MIVTVPSYADAEQGALGSDRREQRADQGDDMYDTPKEMERWTPLVDALKNCQPICKAYRLADNKAKRVQSWHQHLYIVAAFFGTVAILFAILQLRWIISGSLVTFPRLEGLAAFIALVAVLFGILGFVQQRWMGLRHKAECFKFLKFEFLVDPRLWGTDPEKRARAVKDLQDRARKIEKIETEDELKRELERCAESEIFPEEPPHLAGSQANAYTLYNLVDYYLTKRCMSQLEYFQHKSQQLSQKDPRIKLLPPLLFFLSISAALVHFSLDSFETPFQPSAAAQSVQIIAQTPAFGLSITLIIIAAALPVIGAGVRTFRSAYEAARNRSRYCAASSALQPTADRLVDRLADRLARDAEFLRRPSTEGKMTVDAQDVFRDMWRCEQILQAEHHEWVRLMMEAEWFG